MTSVLLREQLASAELRGEPNGHAIQATPFAWRDRRSIPQRPWVYGRWLLRGTVTAVVAPGGVGKSSLVASMVLSLTTDRPVLGVQVWGGAKRTWYWNLEDDRDELERQLQAAALLHQIGPDDCGDRLFLDSGLEGAELCIAEDGPAGCRIRTPVVEALADELSARKIDVLIVDPFVSSHSVGENDNGAVDAVVKQWARLAKRSNCSIVLVHHTRKLHGQKVTAEAARGAVALTAAARVTLVLNRMDEQQGVSLGIDDEEERRRLFTVQDDKHNRAPAEKARWYRLASVELGNGEGLGDNVGVVTLWTPPDTFEGVRLDHLIRVQQRMGQGSYRESYQSPEWLGHLVGDVLGIDPQTKSSKARLRRIISEWIENDVLRVTEGKDERRKPVKFVVVGRSALDSAPPD